MNELLILPETPPENFIQNSFIRTIDKIPFVF